MSVAVSTWLKAGARQLPTILTLVGLVALLTWGHANDWKISGERQEAEADKAKSNVAKKTAGRTQVRPRTTGPESSDANANNFNLSVIDFPSPSAVAGIGLATAPVGVQALKEEIEANGVLAYDQTRYAQLAPRATGMVWSVLKKVGNRVVRGEVLALIESADVSRAKADFLQSYVQVELKQQALERIRVGNGVVPDRQLREAEALLREARVRLLHDQQALANLGLPIRLNELAGLTDDQAFQRLRLIGLPELLGKEIEATTGSAGLLPLAAPFDGEIIRISAVRGEAAGPGQPVCLMASTDPIWAFVDVRQEDAGKLRIGQELHFTPDGGGETAEGKLEWISAEADLKTRTVRARASLANSASPNDAGRRLRPNSFGTGRILLRQSPKAIVVPTRSIQQEERTFFVFVRLSEISFQARVVTVGLRDGDLTEVLSGVRADEIVVTTGSHVLKSELFSDRIADSD